MRAILPLLALLLIGAAPAPPSAEIAAWREQASRVTIARDDFGIAHVDGEGDADAVFGMIYAQAEDDFPRIEANYLTALGRTAEADGESAIWQDLRARLYVSEDELKADYELSPKWLRKLMDGWAAGINFYLATHPGVKPRVLKRFEPWMALSFTEGSIGGDIERIDLAELERFYGGTHKLSATREEREPRGSNGIAIAPGLTRDGRTLLLINPHTNFYFRSEQQVRSREGLNVYGAATWGQFFIYQGFNDKAGWMHTSSGVDNVDEFAEVIETRGGKRMVLFGPNWAELGTRPIAIRYRAAGGRMAERRFTTFRTRHGPIVRAEGGKWISFAMMHRPLLALQQSYLRTKVSDLAGFLNVARLQANSSNNIIFADAKGAIAYLHPQYVPRRSDRFDFTRPVDGSDIATDWSTLHSIGDLPNVISPPNGWVMNTNNAPWSAAGAFSQKAEHFPRYMDRFGENYRGLHALKLLQGSKGWTLDSLQSAAYDSDQPAFAELIPGLVAAWDGSKDEQLKQKLAAPIAALRGWNYRWSASSVPTSLAIFWATPLWDAARVPKTLPHRTTIARIRDLPPERQLAALEQAVDRLQRDFGSWQTPWGEINRFQRISGAIDHPFSDAAPSIAVPFTYGIYGSLASSDAAPRGATKRWYGNSGNSFVAVVEFGPRVRARAVSTGGESGDPASRHFTDQAARATAGALRPVYFYPDELKGHIERRYTPGH